MRVTVRKFDFCTGFSVKDSFYHVTATSACIFMYSPIWMSAALRCCQVLRKLHSNGQPFMMCRCSVQKMLMMAMAQRGQWTGVEQSIAAFRARDEKCFAAASMTSLITLAARAKRIETCAE